MVQYEIQIHNTQFQVKICSTAKYRLKWSDYYVDPNCSVLETQRS